MRPMFFFSFKFLVTFSFFFIFFPTCSFLPTKWREGFNILTIHLRPYENNCAVVDFPPCPSFFLSTASDQLIN